MTKTKTYITGRFYAWKEDGETPIAFSFDGDYFHEAINCPRDGSMGEKDADGVLECHWYADYLRSYDGVEDLRYATPAEVKLYMKKCPNWAKDNAECNDTTAYVSPRPMAIIQTPEYTEVVFEGAL